MSEEDDAGLIRTVTAPYRSRSDDEMNILALLYALGLVIVLIPLLPFIVLVWLLGLLSEARTTEE